MSAAAKAPNSSSSPSLQSQNRTRWSGLKSYPGGFLLDGRCTHVGRRKGANSSSSPTLQSQNSTARDRAATSQQSQNRAWQSL
jgi:hypothetical protein